MKKTKAVVTLLLIIILSSSSFAQSGRSPADYLNVPGPILFENNPYNLTWSAHPRANFYKQEYIPKGDKAEKYNAMILMDVVIGNADIKDVVATKVSDLKKLKDRNPIVNYEIITNPKTGEYMLDFLLAANARDGNISIVEHNVYRYKVLAGNTGRKGIMLFGVSTRAYGTAVPAFLKDLKTARKHLMNRVEEYRMPEISIKS